MLAVEASLAGDRRRGRGVIAGDHQDVDPGVTGSRRGFDDAGAQWVGESDEEDES